MTLSIESAEFYAQAGCNHCHGRGLVRLFTNHMKCGRNNKCPCRSGKKFKKCCYGKDFFIQYKYCSCTTKGIKKYNG